MAKKSIGICWANPLRKRGPVNVKYSVPEFWTPATFEEYHFLCHVTQEVRIPAVLENPPWCRPAFFFFDRLTLLLSCQARVP